jgi:hypothetical protein
MHRFALIGEGQTCVTMIRVLITDVADRRAFAMFLSFGNLRVHDDGVATLFVDFAEFDLDEQAQLRIVNRMLGMWLTTRDGEIRVETTVG